MDEAVAGRSAAFLCPAHLEAYEISACKECSAGGETRLLRRRRINAVCICYLCAPIPTLRFERGNLTLLIVRAFGQWQKTMWSLSVAARRLADQLDAFREWNYNHREATLNSAHEENMEEELEATQLLVLNMAKKQTVKLKEKHEEELKQLKTKNKKAKKKADAKQSLKDREQAIRMCVRVMGQQLLSAFGAMRALFHEHAMMKVAQKEEQHRELMIEATQNGDLLRLQGATQEEHLRQLTLQNTMLKREQVNWVEEREKLKQEMLAAQFELQANYALGRLRFLFKQFASDTSLKKGTVSLWRRNYLRSMSRRAEMLAAQVSILKQQLQLKTEGRVVKRTSETLSSCESRSAVMADLAGQYTQNDATFALLSRAEQQSRLQGQLRGLMGEVPDKLTVQEQQRAGQEREAESHTSALAMGLKVDVDFSTTLERHHKKEGGVTPFHLEKKSKQQELLMASVNNIVLSHPHLVQTPLKVQTTQPTSPGSGKDPAKSPLNRWLR